MRYLLFLGLWLLLNTPQAIFAQRKEHSFPLGFATSCQQIAALNTGGWVCIVHADSLPFGISSDALFYMRFNKDGVLVTQKRLPLIKSEKHIATRLNTFSDGSVLLGYSIGPCDVFSYQGAFIKIDTLGEVNWAIEKDPDSLDALPYDFTVAPDGILKAFFQNTIFDIDLQTGQQSNFLPYERNSGSHTFVPGSENFIRWTSSTFELWRKSQGGYVLDEQLTHQLSMGGPLTMLDATNGLFWSTSEKKFYFLKIDFNLTVQPAPVTLSSAVNLLQFTVTNSGQELLLFTLTNGVYAFERYTLAGVRLQREILTGNALVPEHIAKQGDRIGIGGQDVTGVSKQLDGSGFWFRVYDGKPAAVRPDATIAAMQQQGGVTVTEYTFNRWPPKLFDLQGGKWKVQIRNNGDSTLHSVQVNTRLDRDYFVDVCLKIPGQKRLYDSLNLAPGASVWLDFGDVHFRGQYDLPDRICFWTSSPNGQPDILKSNDFFCSAYYTSAVQEGGEESLAVRLTPNPAGVSTTLQTGNGADIKDMSVWITDVSGCVLHRQVVGSSSTPIETAQWPSGLYFVSVQDKYGRTQTEKLVVVH